MKLLLRRDQKSGLTGKIIFVLTVRAELDETEKSNIQKYKLSKCTLYERNEIEGGSGLLGAVSRLALNMANLTISVKDLEDGKNIECKDILEMLAVEDQIKETAQTLKSVLEAAAHFGGEEVIEIN